MPQSAAAPTLYLLHECISGSAHERRNIVAAAAGRAGIGFVAFDSLTCNYTALPQLQAGDMLFNSGHGSTRLETLHRHPGVATFRSCGADIFTNGGDTAAYCAALARQDFPVPRIVHRPPPDNDRLAETVDYLAGFPLVVKAGDGTLGVGVGVMLIEAMRSLRSVLDFLRTTGREFIRREYIEPRHVARLVVLGGKAVASLRRAIHPDDFRGLPYRMGGEQMAFGDAIERLAISASVACHHGFTGVGVITDPDRKALVLEVNPPSNIVAHGAGARHSYRRPDRWLLASESIGISCDDTSQGWQGAETMSIVINIRELNGFTENEAAHFRKAADVLSLAVNHPEFITRVISAPYKETFFKPKDKPRTKKTPQEIAEIITQGIERGTAADGTIDIAIRKDPTIEPNVVGITTVGVLPFRTSAWFIERSTNAGDTIQPARHMLHEWLHVAGFVHKKNNGYRPDVAYLVGGIVRDILRTMQSQKADSSISEDADLARDFDASMDHVDDD